MKYSVILICFFLIACSGSENQTTATNDPTKNSNACEICLVSDSLTEIEMATAVNAALQEKDGREELFEIAEKLRARLDSLITEFEKDAAYAEASKSLQDSKWFVADTDPVSIAFQACRLEYPFDKIVDEKKREELFLNYFSYANSYDPFEFVKSDTSEFLKEDGNYLVKVRGEMIMIPFAEFEDYWSKVLASYDKLTTYFSSKQNTSVEPLSGKKLEDFSKIELLMFESHATGYGNEYKKNGGWFEWDTLLNEHHEAVWRALENKKD